MTQADRTKLFNLSYGLDNLPRVYVPKGAKPYRQLGDGELEKRRMQENIDQLYILISEAELAKLAEDIRECAAHDEERLDLTRRRA